MTHPAAHRSSRATLVCALAFLGAALASQAGADTLPSVTVEAQRQREQLKHDVDGFVATAIVQSHYGESLERWTHEPVCPLVSGLKKERGEFVLARLSEIARAAGAPLGAENCKPNFFVIVSQVTRDILSAIVVVDPTKILDLNFGQLTDYIAMIGLAEVDLDKDLGDAPTILSLFRNPAGSRPLEMTPWDRALLHALYNTSHKDKMQLSEMQTAALNEIVADKPATP